MTVIVPVSIGELIDKITILEIKVERLKDPIQIGRAKTELEVLELAGAHLLGPRDGLRQLKYELRAVNRIIWDLEESVRKAERARDFGAEFVANARKIYLVNDERAALKRDINALAGSSIVEEKSHDLRASEVTPR